MLAHLKSRLFKISNLTTDATCVDAVVSVVCFVISDWQCISSRDVRIRCGLDACVVPVIVEVGWVLGLEVSAGRQNWC